MGNRLSAERRLRTVFDVSECRYDLLVIDLDGTLLRADGTVSERNRRAVDAARRAGLDVVIATGRALIESRTTIEAVGHDGLLVAAGGSLLCDVVSGRTVDRHVMPPAVVQETTEALIGHGHKVLILKDSFATGYDYLAVGPGELDPASQWWFEQIPVDVRFVDALEHDPHPNDTVRTAVVAHEQELTSIAEDLRRQLGDRALLQHWSAVTETAATGAATHLLEVFNPKVNKWTMINAHCARCNIDPTRVAAIGDGLNDVELVREAGLGVAMANADPRTAAVADRTTADHDADGVALAIEHMLAGTW